MPEAHQMFALWVKDAALIKHLMLTEFCALLPTHGVDSVAAIRNPGRALIMSLHYPYPQKPENIHRKEEVNFEQSFCLQKLELLPL